MRYLSLIPTIILLLHTGFVGAQQLPKASPESVGMSSERLGRLTRVLEEYSTNRQIAGAVMLVARNGRVVYHEAVGMRDLEQNARMMPDTIFRIASQTKALTSVGIMMLVEEGRLLLSDRLSKYIPAYENATVRSVSGAEAIAALRPMTIRDLLTHTAGISYGGEADLSDQYAKAGFTAWYFADRAEPMSVWMEKLATLPFARHSGSFVYGYSTDILGAVIERVTGQTLDAFFRSRITDPLKMRDTHFFLPAEKASRLATVYSLNAGTLTRAPDGHPGQGHYVSGPRIAFSGGAGLLSTAVDYARFLQMLLNGGELEGTRLLSPRTVALMTADHIGARYGVPGRGFGLGFETVEDLGHSGRHGSEGEYGWGGAYFSRYWVDPRERVVAVFLAQLLPAGGNDLQEKVRALVSQAIIAPVRDNENNSSRDR